MFRNLLFAAVQALEAVSPEGVKGIAFITDRAVFPDFLSAVELGQLVVDVGDVGCDIVCQLPDLVFPIETEFSTGIGHLSDIGGGAVAVAHMGRSAYAEQHLLGVSFVNVHITCEPVFKEGEVDAGIDLFGAFPFSAIVYIGENGGSACNLRHLPHRVTHEGRTRVEHCQKEGVLGNLVIAYPAPAETQFQIIQCRDVLHEVFLREPPGGGKGWEIAPGVLLEFAGAVGPEIEGQKVTAVVGIVGPSEQGEPSGPAGAVPRLVSVLGGLGKIPVGLNRRQDVRTGPRKRFVAVLLGGLAEHEVEGILSQVEHIGQGVLHHHGLIPAHALLEEVQVHLVVVGILVGILEEAVAGVGQVHADIALEYEILNRSQLQVNISYPALGDVQRVRMLHH